MIQALKQIISWRGKPQVIRCDNGPENISGTIQNWAKEWDIRFEYIQPGKPLSICMNSATGLHFKTATTSRHWHKLTNVPVLMDWST